MRSDSGPMDPPEIRCHCVNFRLVPNTERFFPKPLIYVQAAGALLDKMAVVVWASRSWIQHALSTPKPQTKMRIFLLGAQNREGWHHKWMFLVSALNWGLSGKKSVLKEKEPSWLHCPCNKRLQRRKLGTYLFPLTDVADETGKTK